MDIMRSPAYTNKRLDRGGYTDDPARAWSFRSSSLRSFIIIIIILHVHMI